MNAAPTKECDIIMKGGITSGVVYPRAILRLSEQHRFRSIGGTSAGAIAAVITAAAEHNRAGGGFYVIKKLPDEIEQVLESLFQPRASVRPVFDAAKIFLSDKSSVLQAALKIATGYWGPLLLAVVVAAVFAYWAIGAGNIAAAVLGVVLALLLGILGVAVRAALGTARKIRQFDFGFCPGRTQVKNGPPGLSDWLADKIELAAGRMQDGKHADAPLTFGDVWRGKNSLGTQSAPEIDLRMMTTNLSIGRPHTLPEMDKNHYFKETEFREIFPDWIVDHLVKVSKAFPVKPGHEAPAGYLRFPVSDAMPLVVAARMSLSFPILFSAVPLYRKDYSLQVGDAPAPVARMLFSDGGISSNFPVHFFDSTLPTRPTFGVSLESWDQRKADRRVQLAVEPGAGMWLDGRDIKSYSAFFSAILSAAKDWQDRLQSTLPGYRERIASVYLDDNKEGGLHLTMSKQTIGALVGFGDRAGGLMTGTAMSPTDRDPFDFDEHRWRRFLLAFARFEESLQTAAGVWTGAAANFGGFINTYKNDPKNYKNSTPQWRTDVYDRFDALMRFVAGWPSSLRTDPNGQIPKPDSVMRITPKP